MKKIAIAALSLFTVFTLISCTVSSADYAKYKNRGITENMYKYLLAYYKSSFYSMFSQYGFFDPDAYDEAVWDETADGEKKLYEQVCDHVDGQINEMLVCSELYESYADADTKKLLDNTVNDFIDQDMKAVGSRADLNAILGQYGMNVNSLCRLFEFEAKAMIVEDRLFGDGGEAAVTDDERERYYQENYSRIKHILIKNDVKYVLDENGSPKMDIYTGRYVTEELTDDEKAEKLALAKQIEERAKNGEDFEALIEEYNEDSGMSAYTDGYFVTAETLLDLKYVTAALTLKTGEVTLAETSYGYVILKKYPLEAGLWSNEISSAFFEDMDGNIISEKKTEIYGKYYGGITREQTEKKTLFSSVVPLDSRLISREND